MSMINRSLITMLSVFFAVSLFSVVLVSADEAESVHETFVEETGEKTGLMTEEVELFAAASFSSGCGTAEDPYIICTPSELLYFANIVNTGKAVDGAYYKLGSNVNLNGINWTPIGTKQNPFRGYFDGGFCIISNLSVKSSDDGQGLFGYTDCINDFGFVYGEISNLVVMGSVTGGNRVGGIVGDAEVNINNCIFVGTVTGNKDVGGIVGFSQGGNFDVYVKNCKNYGVITGDTEVGGISGNLLGTISNCSNYGNVSGAGADIGGIVGHLQQVTVEKCFNKGDITSISHELVGGIAGSATLGAKIINCYNSGSITGGGEGGAGITGELFQNGATCSFCYNMGTVVNGAPALPNGCLGAEIEAVYYIQGKLGETYRYIGRGKGIPPSEAGNEDSYAKFDFNAVWEMEKGYPTLKENPEIEKCDLAVAYANSNSVIVYENTKKSVDGKDKYVLSANATIKHNSKQYATDENGIATIENLLTGDITVTKAEYITKTLSRGELSNYRTVYLEKDSDNAPVIYGCVVDNCVDVVYHEYQIDRTSEKSINLVAQVKFPGGSNAQSVWLQQDSKCAYFSDKLQLSLALKEEGFDVTREISLFAESDGKRVKRSLKFSVHDSLSGWKFSLGESISATFPSDIPIIGGMKTGINISPLPIEIDIVVDGDKVYGTIGVDVAKYSKKSESILNINGSHTLISKSERTLLFEDIKSDFQKLMKKASYSEWKTKYKKALYNYSSTFAFDAEFSVLGYVEGCIKSDGTFEFLDGGVILNPSVKCKVENIIPIPIPFVYWNASVEGDIKAAMEIWKNEKAEFLPNGKITGEVKLSGNIGLGLAPWLSLAEGGAWGSLSLSYEMYKDDPNYFSISGEIGAKAKIVTIGSFTAIEKSWSHRGKIWDYPSTRVNADLYDESISPNIEYELIDRSYVEKESVFTANNVTATLQNDVLSNKNESVFKSNVYPYSEPQIVEFSNGTRLMLWLDDNNGRSTINSSSLYWSYFNGDSWSLPKELNDDGTADYMPNIYTKGNTAYVSWVNTKCVLDEEAIVKGEEEKYVISSWEIATAVFENGSFGNFSIITDNGFCDAYPKIFGNDSNTYVAWISTTDDSLIKTGSKYSIMLSKYSDGQWDEPIKYASDLTALNGFCATIVNNEVCIAYSCFPEPSEFSSYHALEIFINNERITSDDTIDSNPVFDDDTLYWYNNGNISSYDLISKSKQDSLIDSPISTDRFKIIKGPSGKAITFASSKDEKTNAIFACLYDSGTNTWSDIVQLTEADSNIVSFSGFYSADNRLQLAINKQYRVNDGSESYADIRIFTLTPTMSLEVLETYFDVQEVFPGNIVNIPFQVHNNGEVAVNSYVVNAYGEDGELITSAEQGDLVSPGKTTAGYLPLIITDDMPKELHISAKVSEEGDYEFNSDESTIYLTHKDVAVENAGFGMKSNGNVVIYTDIVNRGHEDEKNIKIELREDSATGIIVATKTIERNLSMLDMDAVSFEIPYTDDKVYYIVASTDDDFSGNNTDFVYVYRDNDTNPSTVIGDANEDGSLTFYDVVLLIKYLCGNEKVEISKTNCDINSDGIISLVDLKQLKDLIATETVYSGNVNEDISWSVNRSGVLNVFGYGEMVNYDSVSDSPWYKYRERINKIEISGGIWMIGTNSFSDFGNLSEVTMDNSVVSIRNNAFSDCNKLSKIKLSTELTTISYGALKNTEITENDTNRENGILYYNNYIFDVESATIPEECVIRDGTLCMISDAFFNCKNIRSLVIPNSMRNISYASIRSCDNLESISIGTGVEFIDDNSITYCKNLKEITIPPNVKRIGSGALLHNADGFVIYGYSDTAAEKYAHENSIPFRALE